MYQGNRARANKDVPESITSRYIMRKLYKIISKPENTTVTVGI